MSTHSPTGEVFGEKVALSAAVLFVAIASSIAPGTAARTAVAAPHVGETVVVSAQPGEMS